MERLLGFDGQLLFDGVLTAVNLLILFFVLSYFLFEPAKKLLRERRDRIAGELLEADRARESAGKLKGEYEARLAAAGRERQEILEEARRMAGERETEILRAAEREAEEIRRRAEAAAEMEYRQAEERLRMDVASAAVMTAEKVLGALASRKLHSQLVEETLKEMDRETWQVR